MPPVPRRLRRKKGQRPPDCGPHTRRTGQLRHLWEVLNTHGRHREAASAAVAIEAKSGACLALLRSARNDGAKHAYGSELSAWCTGSKQKRLRDVDPGFRLQTLAILTVSSPSNGAFAGNGIKLAEPSQSVFAAGEAGKAYVRVQSKGLPVMSPRQGRRSTLRCG